MAVSATPAPSSGTPSAPPSAEPSRTVGADDPNCRGGLDVQGVTITYSNGHTALRNATFCTPPGSITALVGVNGSGKSTLFKAIMGFLKPAAGRIEVLGRSVAEAIRRNQVAYVPQNEEVDWDFPVLVKDVVMMGRYGHMGFFRRPKAADHAAVDDALQRVEMQNYRLRQIGELSGGQKKRVFLARALAHGETEQVFTRANLEAAFGGVLRHFDLPQAPGSSHTLSVGIMTDDERPLVMVGGRSTRRGGPESVTMVPDGEDGAP